jgi:surfactin synthase thioesterase subunit
MAAWSEETTRGCEVLTFDGGHFFPEVRHDEMVRAVLAARSRVG